MTLSCGRKNVPLFESKADNSLLNLAFFPAWDSARCVAKQPATLTLHAVPQSHHQGAPPGNSHLRVTAGIYVNAEVTQPHISGVVYKQIMAVITPV